MFQDDIEYIEEGGGGGGVYSDQSIRDSKKEREFTLEDRLVLADILSKRFAQIFKEKKIDIDEFAENKGSWLSKERIQRFGDGTYNTLPRENRLKMFLENSLKVIPDKIKYRWLEHALGFKLNEICACYKEQISMVQFFQVLGYLDQHGNKTSKYNSSPRVIAYSKHKKDKEKALKKEQKEIAKMHKQQARQKSENYSKKLKSAVQGFFQE